MDDLDLDLTGLHIDETTGPSELDLFLNRQAEDLMRMFISNLNNIIAMLKSSPLLLEEQLVPALNHCAQQAVFNFLTNLSIKYAQAGQEEWFFNDHQQKFKLHCEESMRRILAGQMAGEGQQLNG